MCQVAVRSKITLQVESCSLLEIPDSIVNVTMDINIQSHLAKYTGMSPFTIIEM